MDNPPLKVQYLKTSQIKKMWDDGDLYVNKNYQRRKIWSKKQSQKLIESIMKHSPIGAMTIWENSSQMEVLDGQQRINSIAMFLDNNLEIPVGKINTKKPITKKFQDFSTVNKDRFLNYVIPCLQVMSTKESDVSAIFVRLQEGMPLNIAEKTHALTGEFKNEFIEIYQNNPLFFKNYSDKRLRATFMAAQFLALELKVNFDDKYPPLKYEDFEILNDIEYKDGVPSTRIKNCDENIKFMYATLYNLLKKITPRDIISIYMLSSYLRKNVKNYERLGEKFREFVTMTISELGRFSIYTLVPPDGMLQKTFDDYMQYKVIARKATTPDSLAKRFEFFLEQWKKFESKSQHEDIRKKDFKKVPNYLLDELLDKPFEIILKENESIFLEFISFVFDASRKLSTGYTKHATKVVETLSAFLNTDGGLLVLGVSSEKKQTGLNEDFQEFSKEENWKKWEQEFSKMVERMIGSRFNAYWKLEKKEYEGKTFALVKIKKGLEPAYVGNGNDLKFYTRYFDKNKQLNSKNRARYINVVFR